MTHPGLTDPGEPGTERYLCPLCDWYLDVPPIDLNAPPRELRNPPRVPTLAGYVEQALLEEHQEREGAIIAHLVEAHTAPVVLAHPQG